MKPLDLLLIVGAGAAAVYLLRLASGPSSTRSTPATLADALPGSLLTIPSLSLPVLPSGGLDLLLGLQLPDVSIYP